MSGDGTVTYGVGNPYQSTASAIVHPSGLLYTDSEVDLDAATGHLRWYYQALPDDFKDYDLQASPISASINGTPVVIGAGKMGYVYAIGAQTGTLVWKTRAASTMPTTMILPWPCSTWSIYRRPIRFFPEGSAVF